MAGGVSHAKLAIGHQQKVIIMKKIMNLFFRKVEKKPTKSCAFFGDPLDEPAFKRQGLTIKTVI